MGDRLEITLPFGDLTAGIGSVSPLVLISAGIGITPMVGILEHLAARTPQRGVLLVHEDRSARTHPLRDRMLDPTGLDLPEDADFVRCGGAGFLRTIRSFLRERRIPDSRVHTEQFTPTDWREGTR